MVDHALGPFSFLSRFDAIRILQRKYPQKNKSDNKQQSQNEITWPEADRFPPISYTAYQSLKKKKKKFYFYLFRCLYWTAPN
jgi:hypothetical protein